MSEELAPLTSVKKRRGKSRKKYSQESNENCGEIIPHCSNKISEKNEEKLPLVNIKGEKIKNGKQSEGKVETPKTNGKQKVNTPEIAVQIAMEDNQKGPKKGRKKCKEYKKKDEVLKYSKNIEKIIVENGIIDLNTEEKNMKNAGTTLKALREKDTFPIHIPIVEMEEILVCQKSQDLEYVKGYLRINPRFYKYAYVCMSDKQPDILISGLRDRNRAFDGDLVVVKINSEDKWQTSPEGKVQKTGTVVCILEEIHPRKTVGYLKKQGAFAQLHPKDQRVPLLRIHAQFLPKQFLLSPNSFKDTLFFADILHWQKPHYAEGKIINIIGDSGDIEAETNAIILAHDLVVRPFTREETEGLPDSDSVVTEDEIKCREDWRKECIFTIDPATAVDLDDAVSCKLLGNGNYEIGVHISDVTHYLKFLSPLDIEVAKRATTIYMTQNVYHMLPKQLCEVCSLLPGKDKLAFSVIWEMTPEAEVVDHRFAKTVIKSCCQLSYEHAQMFIENPTKDWPDDYLSINGDFSIYNLSIMVNTLYKLSKQMRDRRFAGGALRINQPKLYVILDKNTGLPVSYSIEEQKDSNRLIEEFMLLANTTVAAHLYNTIPETALLRNHREPSKFMLDATKITLQKFGVHLSTETAGDLQASIQRYEADLESDFEEIRTMTKYRMMVINNLCSKAMARATYKCASTVESEEDLKHYALNVPFYTHFTSPIRRYSDCVVHRLLYSTIQNEPLPDMWTKKLCAWIASNCNVRKYNAKVAQEESNEVYFTYLVELRGPLVTVGIVVDVKENSIDVILCQIGIKLRVYFADIADVANIIYSTDCSVPTINLFWKQPVANQVINVFTVLYLKIEKHPKAFRLIGTILPPQ